ncbi:hypothetical protein [Streptomyces sp. TP-A0356]|uniref:hypothetical protein n=1 Tax=Streptomyces sp. TP-A0356 TaxID=1359208 RepID=UPI00131CCF9F|nr:hypothetical protein [Streptomyces sp. TP-A0356]
MPLVVRRSSLFALASTLALAPALSAGAAAPTGCKSSACTGRSPQGEGCGSGAKVIDRVRAAGRR